MRYRWAVENGWFTPKDEELAQYSFLEGGIKEGLQRSRDFEDEEESGEPSETSKGQGQLRLNSHGFGSFNTSRIPASVKTQTLRLEAEYRDPNGDVQTVSSRSTIWPTDRLVGIRARGWGRTKKDASFEAVVLDLKEKPVAGVDVDIQLYQTETISHRKRLVGGFFGYENFNEVKKLGRLCQGKTNVQGRLACTGAVKSAGSIRAVARIKDQSGRVSESVASQWIVDNEERLWFGGGDADRIDLLPTKKDFQPGEMAEFQLQTPFPKAKVLVTVEREGIIEHQIVDIDSANPSIRLQVKENWAPNVFVSALVLRGRVADMKPTALLDLGKPAYKMALTEIRVGWKKHELKVKVETDAKVYPVRGKAKASIVVTDAAGKPVQGEVSIAVVDEGLLQLLPNNTWRLLEKMMDPRPLLVRTSTLQTQVIGKRHFGLKALASGGDGGRANLRELFDTLLLWKGTVALNEKGQASVDVPINDSLTSFRVVAIAINGLDQFGTGDTSFRTTQDLMIFAGAPALVREGDRLQLGYTIRNVSSQAKDISLKLESQPVLAVASAPQTLKLAPGESKEIFWPLAIPRGITQWSTTLSASEGTRQLDRIRNQIQVQPVWMPSVRQGTLVAIEKNAKIPLTPAADAVPGSASLQIEMLSGLASGRAGLVDFWKNYRYSCLEQKVSRLVTLNDAAGWKKLEAELDVYTDGNGKLKLFPGPGEGSVVLNTYVLSIAKEAGFRFSADREKNLLAAVEKFAENQDSDRERLSFADEGLRRVTAMDTLSRYGKFKASQLSYVKVTPNLWPTSTLVEWYQFLKRETKLSGQAKLLETAENVLRSRMTFAGAKFAFSDEKSDRFWWLFRGPAVPTAQLILAAAQDPNWKNEIPKVLRGFVQAQKDGAWLLTTENAWGRLALDRYKSIFENTKVTGTSTAEAAQKKASWNWSQGPRGELELPAPTGNSNVVLSHSGSGNPWALVRFKAAVPLREAVSSGFFMTKTVEGLKPTDKTQHVRGSVLRVQLKIKATADAGWVVINDPLPPGAVVLGSGLGNDSQMLNEKKVESLWSSFEERRAEAIRLYYAWVPQGEHQIEYRIRLNQSGNFHLPATRVEAMYDPDVFAETPNADWNIVDR